MYCTWPPSAAVRQSRIAESLALMSADYMAPSREELFFVGAEDIGHFEPMLCHRFGVMASPARISSTEPSVSSGLLVERTALSER